jgi:hypothetical protein
MVSMKYWCTKVLVTYCGYMERGKDALQLQTGLQLLYGRKGWRLRLIWQNNVCLAKLLQLSFDGWLSRLLHPQSSLYCEIFLWILCFLVKFFYCICEITVGVPRLVLPNARGAPPSGWSTRSPPHVSGDSSRQATEKNHGDNGNMLDRAKRSLFRIGYVWSFLSDWMDF